MSHNRRGHKSNCYSSNADTDLTGFWYHQLSTNQIKVFNQIKKSQVIQIQVGCWTRYLKTTQMVCVNKNKTKHSHILTLKFCQPSRWRSWYKTYCSRKGLPASFNLGRFLELITLEKQTPCWQLIKCLCELEKKGGVACWIICIPLRSSRRNRSRAQLLIPELIEICCSLEAIHKIHQSHGDKWQLPHLQRGFPPINKAEVPPVALRKNGPIHYRLWAMQMCRDQ